MPYKITVRDSNLDNQVVLEETVMDTSFSPVQYLMSLHIPGLEIKEPGEYYPRKLLGINSGSESR
jgi:hypothetical protein